MASKKKTLIQKYEEAFGNGTKTEDRGKRYQVWADKQKQVQEQKAEERRNKYRKPSSGGHGF
jgi:hypothetical protein